MTVDNTSATAVRKAVIVLGMHRSGTSGISRVLSLLGCDLPQTLIGPSKNNQSGYWESRAIKDFNDTLLTALDSKWDDWSRIGHGGCKLPELAEFQQTARGLIDSEFKDSDFFVLKDPRISRLATFWLETLKQHGIEPHLVIALRNPLNVAASLSTRNKFLFGTSCLLWLRHMLDAEYISRGFPRAVICYEDMLADWAPAFERASDPLHLSWPRSPAEINADVCDFLRPDLQHHRFAERDVFDKQPSSEWLCTTYEIMLHWARNGEREKDHARLDQVRDELNFVTTAFAGTVPVSKSSFYRLEKKTIAASRAWIKEAADKQRSLEDRNTALQIERDSLKSALRVERDDLDRMRETMKSVEATLESERQRHAEERDALKQSEAELTRHLSIRINELVQITRLLGEVEQNRSAEHAISADLRRIAAALIGNRSRFSLTDRRRLAKDIKALRSMGILDSDFYRKAYVDVAQAGIDPLEHFVRYGLGEGRVPRAYDGAAPEAALDARLPQEEPQ